ncbi:MAG: hypothetical protein IKW18_04135, partial [Clostridia bacterium]|nr:hypothetical protein [Clostridia bacterium]
MKNITKKILSVLMILAVLFTLTACNDDAGQTTSSSSSESTSSIEENTNSESKETTSSSETESSETTKSEETTSSSETETSKPHEHIFGEWTVTKNVTCTEDGAQERTCSCGEKETKSIKASGHVILTVNAKLPTCTEEGFTEKQTCSVCNEILKQSQTVPATGHGWGEGKITK